LKDWTVVIRQHPAMSIQDLEYIHQKKYDFSLLPNVEVSKDRKLSDELQRSTVVLYQASTVCLEALQQGVYALHLNDGRLLDNDPAQACEYLHSEISENDSLSDVLKHYISKPQDERLMDAQKAREYVRRYFYPVTSQSLSLFL
jgi:hypothetical protein